MARLKAFLKSDRFREIFVYLVIGGLTTVINYLVYFLTSWVGSEMLGLPSNHLGLVETATVLSWIVAVVFAFWANKKFVFRSLDWSKSVLKREIPSFLTARILSLGFDVLFMAIAVSLLSINDKIAKLLSQLFIVLINYFASKFWVFKKK